MLGMEWAWLIPAYGFAAFGVIALVGRYLPTKGIFLSILAILAGFITFWPVLFDFIGRGVGEQVARQIVPRVLAVVVRDKLAPYLADVQAVGPAPLTRCTEEPTHAGLLTVRGELGELEVHAVSQRKSNQRASWGVSNLGQ